MVLGLALLQPLAGRAQPAQVGQPVVELSKRGLRRRGVGDRRRQRRAHRVGQRLLDLRAGLRRAAAQPGPSGAASSASGAPSSACAPSCAPGAPSRGAAASASGDGRGLGLAPALHFDRAGLQAAVGEHHALRHADQFPVGEHRAGALAAVVEQHVDAGGRQLVVQRGRRRP